MVCIYVCAKKGRKRGVAGSCNLVKLPRASALLRVRVCIYGRSGSVTLSGSFSSKLPLYIQYNPRVLVDERNAYSTFMYRDANFACAQRRMSTSRVHLARSSACTHERVPI